MTNEQKAIQMVKKMYNLPDEEYENIVIPETIDFHRCLLYLQFQEIKLVLYGSMSKWIKFLWRIDNGK